MVNITRKVERVSLDGEWGLINSEGSIKLNAQVPGTVFEALINKKRIEDPFYGENEHEMVWVYQSDWIYELTFNVDPEMLVYKNLILRFYGLDTIADIKLNGNLIGSTENMFIRYNFDVKSSLKKNGNKLSVTFRSPTITAQNAIKKNGINLNTGYAAIPGVPYLRKAQYSFGWDWGPKLPDLGIWKSVELIGFDDVKIESAYPRTTLEYGKNPKNSNYPDAISAIFVKRANLCIDIEIGSDIEELTVLGYTLKVTLKDPNGKIVKSESELKMKHHSVEFEIINPYLWWTHDLGDPCLYDLEIVVLNEIIVDKFTLKIGLREIKLVTENDKWGESFYFQLNGIPIFAKGANWIPVDSFIPRGKKNGLYSMNLNYAKEANMNMIRVWGGGIYEDNKFYDLCDELGLLVWQDFPFACSVYPHSDTFLEKIREEATQNIIRLRWHPSLALWCGNNEIEVLWNRMLRNLRLIDENNARKWLNPKEVSLFLRGYQDMFEKTLPDLIKKLDGNHSYWPSSPSNGIGKKKGALISNSPDEGDSHFWTVWHGGAPFQEFRKFNSRFMSEFGFESFPSLKTIKAFCPSDQFDIYSKIMENHQKNSAGNKKIMDYMEKRFSIPQKFEYQIILSQITQAEAIEYGVEHWRRNRTENHCMGSLFWQFNDCWPVASWSSLDYFGRWKALHYFAKRFYQPLFASVKEDSNRIEFWATNDLNYSCQIELEWKIISSDGALQMKGIYSVSVSPCSSLKLGVVDVSIINKDQSTQQNNVIFYTMKNLKNEEGEIFHGFRLFDSPKFFKLKNPDLNFEIQEIQGKLNHFSLEIKTKNIALYVFIDSDIFDLVASDNFFSMEPNETRIIDIEVVNFLKHSHNHSLQEIKNSVKISTLNDMII